MTIYMNFRALYNEKFAKGTEGTKKEILILYMRFWRESEWRKGEKKENLLIHFLTFDVRALLKGRR